MAWMRAGAASVARLGGDSDHLLVQDDHARLTSGIGRKLVGQIGEARVEQTVQSLLEQVHHLGERSGAGASNSKTKYWAWKLPVE